MKSSIECVPCLVRQAMESSGYAVEDEEVRERVMRIVLTELSRMDFGDPPPVAARLIHRIIRNETGVADPYRRAKDRFNSLALQLLPSFEERISRSPDPFGAALRLAIAGNVIDLGAKGDLAESEAFAAVERAFDEPVAGNIEEFREAVMKAPRILYIADNAGEIVFDTPLLRMLPPGRVTVAVRGTAVINDATREDAVAAGIPAIAALIDSGSDTPGTFLEECGGEFRRHYDEASLVIAKGQGNYETLSGEGRDIFFLFKVKCPLVRDHTGFAVGTHALVRSTASRNRDMAAKGPRLWSRPPLAGMSPIGVIRSGHVNPSETPIQPAYAEGCGGYAEIYPEYADGLKDLEGFSHVYIIYHLHRAGPAKLLVKPFLDDVERGLFATRHPSRPNPIGLSIVGLRGIEGTRLILDGVDMLDGTPILDIKPYVKRFDRIDSTRDGWQDAVGETEARRRGGRDRGK